MNERWVTLKDGRRIPIKTNSEYMNTFIRDKAKVKLQKKTNKELTRKDIMDGEPYKGADGYWNIDLKEGYEHLGWSYIWEKTKKEAYNQLDKLVYAENNWRKNKIDELEKKPKKETTPLDSNYTESWLGNWKEQKPKLIEKYEKKYGEQYDNIDVKRVKTDTKGLYSYYVYGNKKNKEE